MPDPPPPPLAGGHSRYEFHRRIGVGGSGVVFLGRDKLLDRQVAIKRLAVINGQVDDALRSLQREAEVLCRINHPNIVRVLDFGQDAQGPFEVMEFLDGMTLHEFVERHGPMLELEFRSLAQQCLDALAAAQEQHLLHRDLKPANIMLRSLPSGLLHVTLLDFGLAKMEPLSPPSVSAVSEEGRALIGTVFFMAPEQFNRLPVDARTDLYSLGCVFYYALTRQYPFPGSGAAEIIRAHRESTPEPLESLRPDLPVDVCRWVHRLMSREPAERPLDAGQALEWLKALLPERTKVDVSNEYFYAEGRPLPKVVSLPKAFPAPVRTGKPRRSRMRLLAAGVCFLLAAVLLGFWGAQKCRQWQDRPRMVQRGGDAHLSRPIPDNSLEREFWIVWRPVASRSLLVARGMERLMAVDLSQTAQQDRWSLSVSGFGVRAESKPVSSADPPPVTLRMRPDGRGAWTVALWTGRRDAEPPEGEADLVLTIPDLSGADALRQKADATASVLTWDFAGFGESFAAASGS